LLAIGETIIETPNVFRSRYFETFSYKNMLIDYMKSGSKWIAAPKPRLLDDSYNTSDHNKSALNNVEPVFDAANVLRAGKDILYLVSDSGNELGCQWLQSVLGKDYRVHPCRDLYSSMHIDSTISLLKPGLALINPSRVREDNLPLLLKNWDLLTCPEMISYKYSDLGSFSTPWLGMNLLMLAPDLAVVDKHQEPLIRLLEKNGIATIPLALRHGRTLGGGFHCITLDVRRKGKFENYA
jgi:glycine amidinotransferase